MAFEEITDRLFVSIAKSLKMACTKTRGGYMLSDEESSFGFITFIDRDGKMKITMSTARTKRPIDLGNYTREELNDKAKRAIITKVVELRK